MTREEMNEQLPNGLHDAEIESFLYDLLTGTLTFQLNCWTGTLAAPDAAGEAYRRGKLTFHGVLFFSKTEWDSFDDKRATLLTWDLQQDLEGRANFGEKLGAKKLFSLPACYFDLQVACDEATFAWSDPSSESH